MAKLICFKTHILGRGFFAARKGEYFAYLEITSQQRASFPPGECRGEHQGTTGLTLVRNLSASRRTRSPPVLWYYSGNATMAICKTVTEENNLLLQRMRCLQDFANKFSSSSTLSWAQSNSIYVACYASFNYNTLSWSYLRWDNKATTMIESC